MSIVNDLIDNFIDQHEILSNALLIEDTAEVTKDLHHSVQDVHHV